LIKIILLLAVIHGQINIYGRDEHSGTRCSEFIAAEVTAIIEKPVMHRMEPRSGNLCQAEANKRMNAKQQTMSCLLLKDLFIHKYHY